MDHTNIVRMQHAFFTSGEKPEDSTLNIVMDFIPMNLHRVNHFFNKLNQLIHPLLTKLYSYQLIRGLAYIHNQHHVIHRDIKPLNLLVDPTCHCLKICDFGSAKKKSVDGQKSTPYITSRYYRAPELLFGQEFYSESIDTWSVGCVMAELMIGQPLFKGLDTQN